MYRPLLASTALVCLLATALADVNESDDSDSEYQTPSSDTAPPLFEGEGESHVTTPAMPRDGGSTASPRNASQAPASGRSSAATATGQSFVLSDAGCVDEESARAAGIPVVASRDFKAKQQERGPTPRRQWNRPQVSAHCFRRVIHHAVLLICILLMPGTSWCVEQSAQRCQQRRLERRPRAAQDPRRPPRVGNVQGE